MNKREPIINLSILTEEQKQILKERFSIYSECAKHCLKELKDSRTAAVHQAHYLELREIFGEDFFKKQ